ncbi:hypothetical protein G9A89_021839 [Geosiphon pyriformis]|nr:hypothetical protein G9A89_021839 [Geosiphon pyriformis]
MLRSNNILPSSSPTLFNTTNTPISSSTNSNNNQQLSWEFLRKQARQLENEIEQKLTSYSKIAASVGRTRNRELGSGNASLAGRGGNNVGNSNEAMELELDELVKKLSMVVSSMAEVVDRPSSTTTNPSMMHMLQRHRDILYDYTKEFKKTKVRPFWFNVLLVDFFLPANIQAARNHADLLSSVREDISSFKSGATSETDYFLSERSRIESSHRMTDIIIEQAYETREEFGRQRATLLNINSRMGGIKGKNFLIV